MGATGFDGIKTLLNGMRSTRVELNISGNKHKCQLRQLRLRLSREPS